VPNDKLLEYFYEYCEDSAVMSYPGFYKFLALSKKFTPQMMKEMQTTFIEYPDTYMFIKKVCEGDVVEKALNGSASSPMSQFVLKHKHGYVDNVIESSSGVSEISVTFK
jgi:hypothetical protein